MAFFSQLYVQTLVRITEAVNAGRTFDEIYLRGQRAILWRKIIRAVEEEDAAMLRWEMEAA